MYKTAVIDPPWPIKKIIRKVRPNQKNIDYNLMTLDEIEQWGYKILIPKLEKNAHIYLWTTHKHLPNAINLIIKWKFKYQCILTWVKNVGFTPFSFMYSTEHIIFARRGSLKLLKLGKRLDFAAKVTKHSEKPNTFYELVKQVSPDPRIDFFARRKHDGFIQWGDEIKNV